MNRDVTHTLDPASLPDDPALLKRLLVDYQRQALEEIEQLKAEQQSLIEAAVSAAVLAILRRYYGPRSERFDPRQLLLFGERLTNAPLDAQDVAEEAGEELATRKIAQKHKHGRRPLPDHLERIEIEHDLNESERPCPCCGTVRQRIGSEVSEQLEYFPASFKVLKHIRYKYVCRTCDHEALNPQIVSAPKPPQPLDRGLPGPGLLAYVITSKLGDHLPLYRLERIFERQQVHVARSTLCAWIRSAGELVKPLTNLLSARVRRSRVIHTDDTPVPVQAPGTGKCRQGRIWTYVGDTANPYVVYAYTPNRQRAGPAEWLEGYSGYLQADAYGGYDGIFQESGVQEVACWAHARRKFYDAQDSERQRASEMLSLIGELYGIEREARDLDEAARTAVRQERSLPVLEKIGAWLEREQESVLQRSPLAQAIGYARNQWKALNIFATQGFLNIDNNAAERALRRVAVGRKNWLFAGTDRAGENHARLWSLIASAERHGLDPQSYLTSVMSKIAGTPVGDLDQFLPDVWQRESAAEPLTPE